MRAVRSVAVAGAITAAGIFGLAAPAQAVDRNCASGYFCVWAGANFSTSYPMYRISYEYTSGHNWATYLPERRKMMQAWADYLDAARQGGKVVPLKAA